MSDKECFTNVLSVLGDDLLNNAGLSDEILALKFAPSPSKLAL